MVDGRQVGTIRDGETVDIEVPAGRHSVRLVIAWTGSHVVDVDVPEGGFLTVRCSAKQTASALLDLFSRTGWIHIEADATNA
jgi:hypothetical protein